MALSSEGTGKDCLSVTWQLPKDAISLQGMWQHLPVFYLYYYLLRLLVPPSKLTQDDALHIFSPKSPVLDDPLQLLPAQPRLRDVCLKVTLPSVFGHPSFSCTKDSPGRKKDGWHCSKPGHTSSWTEVLVSFVVHVSVAKVVLTRWGAGPTLDPPPFSDGLGTMTMAGHVNICFSDNCLP